MKSKVIVNTQDIPVTLLTSQLPIVEEERLGKEQIQKAVDRTEEMKKFDNIILVAINVTTGLNYGSGQSKKYMEQIKRVYSKKFLQK
tara:strand:- start:685 stop:945 length:261 start_codon:yes stop_codon:yes gene_type:complete